MSIYTPSFQITLNYNEVPVTVIFLLIITISSLIGIFSEEFTKFFSFIPA